MNIGPVGGLGRDMAAEAIFLVVDRHLLVRSIGFEECPAPSIAPQRIIPVANLFHP